MPRPKEGHGQTSSLRSALNHPDPEVVRAFIARVAAAYGREQDLERAAKEFGCGRRTLERAIQDFPALGEAINRVREGLAIVG